MKKIKPISQKEEKKEFEEPPKELKGVEGWLAFFVFTLFMSILLNIVVIIMDIGSIIELNLNTYFSMLLVGADLIILLLVLSLIIYTIYSLIKIKQNAIALVKMYLSISLIISIIDIFFNRELQDDPFLSPIRGLVYSIVWLIYFNKSKRVKNTWPVNNRTIYMIDKVLFGSLLAINLFISLFLPLYFNHLSQEPIPNLENSTLNQQYTQENRIPINADIEPDYYLSYVLYDLEANYTKPAQIYVYLTTDDSFDFYIFNNKEDIENNPPVTTQKFMKYINKTFWITKGNVMVLANSNDKNVTVEGFVEYLG